MGALSHASNSCAQLSAGPNLQQTPPGPASVQPDRNPAWLACLSRHLWLPLVLHLANEHLRARRVASHRLQPSGPRCLAEIALAWPDAVTSHQYPTAIEGCSVRALGSLGSRCCYLYPLTYLLHVAAWKRGQRFVIFVFSCSVVRLVARFDRV